MKLTSDVFKNNEPIPKKYTCFGENVSPALMISEIPLDAKSLCLIVDDPDAPNGTFDHWIAWNIPPTKSINEGESVGVEGKNHFGENGYKGPRPPPGPIHHYHFKLYAIDDEIHLPEGSSKEQVLKAIKSHILDQAELVGTYQC